MSLQLILGPMFSGKSTAVLSILRKNKVIGRPTLCITSALDTRYTDEAKVCSHDLESAPAVAAKDLVPLLQDPRLHAAACIIVEEAQFFTDLRPFIMAAVDALQKEVIVVGLDGDSERQHFGQIADLLPVCDSVTKLKALCTRCKDGTEAIFTFRTPGAPKTQVNVAGADQYEPLCRKHFLRGQFEAADHDPAQLKLLLERYIHPVCAGPEQCLNYLLELVDPDEVAPLLALFWPLTTATEARAEPKAATEATATAADADASPTIEV